VLPVDCPLVTAELLASLVAACEDGADAAVPQTGPLPGAYRASALSSLQAALERGDLKLRDALSGLETRVVPCDESLLVNVNTRDELRGLSSA
jgi:molybdopterin-guanine dinucleotide biosynthesis protein A